jgi:hypothetical protein
MLLSLFWQYREVSNGRLFKYQRAGQQGRRAKSDIFIRLFLLGSQFGKQKAITLQKTSNEHARKTSQFLPIAQRRTGRLAEATPK